MDKPRKPDPSRDDEERDADPNTQSIDMLKETRELADITTADNVDSLDSEATSLQDAPTAPTPAVANTDTVTAEPQNIETVFENQTIDPNRPNDAPQEANPDPPQELSNTVSSQNGRMNKLRDHSSNIFPAGIMGCKESVLSNLNSPRRFLDAHEASKDSIGHIDKTPRKMPAAVKSDPDRNPLTGAGVNSSDDLKKGATKKKVDGNPLLGLGYETKSNSSSTKIPPGGFSAGLW